MAIVEGNVDLFVLTVTAPEQQAAKKVIQKAAGKAMEKRDCLNTITKELAVVIHYVEWDDFFESKESGPAKIALACASEMGLESSAQGVVLISQTTLKPSVIVMVGICAGYEKGVNLGDVLVPFCITRASGKEYADKTFAASAKFTEIDLSLKKILTSEATSSKSSWGRFIPDDMTSTPSPVYLHDFILSKIPPPGKTVSFGAVYRAIKKEKPEWTKEAISIHTLKEVVCKIQLETEGFVTSNDAFGEKMSLERTSKGQQYVEAKSVGGQTDFPKNPTNPAICIAEVYSGNTANENINFKKIGEDERPRKFAGYEMEGYSFLCSAEKNLPRAHRLFAKGVSDLGSPQSKMDYYQPYCAASAMAVVCHLFKGRDFLFERGRDTIAHNYDEIVKSLMTEACFSSVLCSAGPTRPRPSAAPPEALTPGERLCSAGPTRPRPSAAPPEALTPGESLLSEETPISDEVGTKKPAQDDGLPSDETPVNDEVALAVSHTAFVFWQQIADTLKVQTININKDTAISKLHEVIKLWILAAKTIPTVGKLLRACELNGVGRLSIAQKYKEIRLLRL
ncbi:uncharacterized protein [Oscarella lobularis]|uniref:uncharacterized protein isoform X2 n=1 Tax=Oscarella lobularis TaxID=121494 RepID=UPI003314430F